MHRCIPGRENVKGKSCRYLLVVSLMFICLMAWEDNSSGQNTGTDEQPTEQMFSNPAQAQHALNVATPVAMRDPEVAAAIAKAQATGNPADIARAEALLAEMVGVITEDIADMRETGMGWGRIAREFGVHPGVLGLGHSKNGLQTEFREATARNLSDTSLNGHGLSGSESGSKGLGLGHAKGYSDHPGQGLGLGRGAGSDRGAGQGSDHGGGHGGGHGGNDGHGGGHGK